MTDPIFSILALNCFQLAMCRTPDFGRSAVIESFQKSEAALKIAGFDDPATLIENSRNICTEDSFLPIAKMVQSDWRMVTDAVFATQPEAFRKALLLVGASQLNVDQYRDFLTLMLDHADAGNIDPREMEWAIF